MKLTNVLAASVILAVIALAPVRVNAQDKKIDKAEDKKAVDKADRNKAEKNGNAKLAKKDEKKVQKDDKNIKKDKKEEAKK